MKATPEEIRSAVEEGIITQSEADYYLDYTYRAPRRRLITTLAVLLVLASTLFLFIGNNGLTGMLTYQQNAAANESITNATSITVTGVLYGEGTASVWFDTAAGSRLIANITSDTGAPRTDKAGYAVGESISVEHAPSDATYYFDDGVTSAPVSPPFAATVPGTLLIVANESGNLTTYRLPISIGDAVRTTLVTDACAETCSMEASSGNSRIETTGDVTLNMTLRVNVPQANHPPIPVAVLPPVTVNASATLDLAPYFADPDGDALHFSTGASDIVDASVNGSVLTLTALRSGDGALFVYTSDLRDVISSSIELTSVVESVNAMNESAPLIIPPVNISSNETPSNVTPPANITGNATPNVSEGVNATINETAVNETTTNVTTNATTTLDCSNPDPNLRPVDCLTGNNTLLGESIYWENIDRKQVARITPIGNLLITGRVLQGDTATPASLDFRITYLDNDFNSVPTIWVDSATGDLHLRGRLYEENANIVPPQDSYSVMNRRGVFLVYSDRRAGDLYVRGNVIPLRADING